VERGADDPGGGFLAVVAVEVEGDLRRGQGEALGRGLDHDGAHGLGQDHVGARVDAVGGGEPGAAPVDPRLEPDARGDG
jgi:hypothetical protein